MFSGIVEALGTVVELRQEPPGCRLIVREPKIAGETRVADSISVNGCCLTVVDRQDDTFAFQAGPETLARTNLGDLKPGSRVNLERALAVGDRLGGHFVSGHIDGQGALLQRDDSGEWSTFWMSVPRKLAIQMAPKGSIAVDGVSLTIVESLPDRFSLALIPFTLEVTTLGQLKVGDKVNLETDMLAKYVQRLAESELWPAEKDG
jgi:riboflavin synthase